MKSDPIRILHVVTQMNIAGLEKRLIEIYKQIDKTRIQFDFLTFRKNDGDFDKEILFHGGRIFRFDRISILNFPIVFNEVSNFLIHHNEYQIIHSHLNQWNGFILKSAKRANIPVRISHSRTALNSFSFKNMIKNIIKLNVNKYATHRFAVSKKSAIWLYGLKAYNNGTISIWPNAINTNAYKYSANDRLQLRKSMSLEKRLVFIHLGNIRKEKNHRYLIRIFKEILREKKDSILYIIGKDYLKGSIQKYTKKNRILDNVVFTGTQYDIHKFLLIADALIFPSLYEGLPGAVLEAQACGLTCFVSDRISKEVVVNNNVYQISINKSPREWKEFILCNIEANRNLNSDKFENSIYNIKEISYKYSEFYNNLHGTISCKK